MAADLTVVPPLPELEPQTQDALLALLGRILPAYYLEPLKEPGPGYELLQAYAAIGARISRAVMHVANGNFIATAGDGSYSEGTIEFYRDTSIWGAVTLLAGTIVGTASGYTYQTLEPVAFAGTELGPVSVRVRATVRGWLYDQPGPTALENGETIPGAIDRLVAPKLSSSLPNFDPTLKVRQTSPVIGGAAPMLDGLGVDRGVVRADGESTDDYRTRIFLLSETVTPIAIAGLIDRIIGPTMRARGLRYWVYEGWDLRVQLCWDAPINTEYHHAELYDPVSQFNGNIFAYDYAPVTTDAYQPGGWTNLMMAPSDYGAAIIIGLPADSSLYGLYASLAQNLNQAKPAGVPVYYLTA